jgi:hypothetical protein
VKWRTREPSRGKWRDFPLSNSAIFPPRLWTGKWCETSKRPHFTKDHPRRSIGRPPHLPLQATAMVGANALGGTHCVRSDGTYDLRAHGIAGRRRGHPPWGACDPGLLDAQRLVGRGPTAYATCLPLASRRLASEPACSSRRPVGGPALTRTLMPARSSSRPSDHVKKNLIGHLSIIVVH